MRKCKSYMALTETNKPEILPSHRDGEERRIKEVV